MKGKKIEFLKKHLTYHKKKYTQVNSIIVGIIYRLAQLSILFYIIGWELYLNKGYQTFGPISSVVTTKVKGYGYGSSKDQNDHQLEHDFSQSLNILDTTDYVIPPLNYNSLFMMTNHIRTVQSQGLCDEELNKPCRNDDDCIVLKKVNKKWNGIPTDRCVNSSRKMGSKVCEIRAWCPLEDDSYNVENHVFKSILNYSLFIRNDVEFKKFNKRHRNIDPSIPISYLAKCRFHEETDPDCPIFQISYILEKAETNSEERKKILLKGGAIEIKIEWKCDYDFFDSCFPTYIFNRLDVDSSKTKAALGFNFRFANKYLDDKKEYRVLYKAYGIKFFLNVSGTAGRFCVYHLITKIGAGLGLMGISVFIADFLAKAINKKEINETSNAWETYLVDDKMEKSPSNLDIVRI